MNFEEGRADVLDARSKAKRLVDSGQPIVLVSYGLPDMREPSKDEARRRFIRAELLSKYNIQESLGGCILPELPQRLVEREVKAELTRRYGDNFFQRIDNEVEEISRASKPNSTSR